MMPKDLPKGISNSVEDLIPFSKIRLIVADLDGTLLRPDENQIWERILHFKRCVNHYKVKFTIATGRTLSGVIGLLENVGIPKGVPIILYNGSLVVMNDDFKILIKRTISLEAINEIFKITESKSVQILAYFYERPSSSKLKSSYSPIDFEFVLGWSENRRPLEEFNKMTIKWLDWGDYPTQSLPSAILIDTTDEEENGNLLENIIRKIPGITVTRSGMSFLELRPAGSDKGKAIEEVSNIMGYQLEEILAIGDNDNDAELLAGAGIGVAVKSSSKKALENSNYVCQYDSARGAIEVLYLVREAKRYFNNHKIKSTFVGK